MKSSAFTSIIVEDEAGARERLHDMLSQFGEVEVIGSYGDPQTALQAIRRDSPDLLVLGIELANVSGFEILETLGDHRPPGVILVTTCDRHAVRAFDADAADFLVQPFDERRLGRAIERAAARARQRSKPHPGGGGVPKDYLRLLPIRTDERIILLPVHTVALFEAEGKNIRVHAGSGAHVVRVTVQRLMQRLDPRRFMRISRSAIINLDHVEHVEPWSHGEYRVSLRTGHRPISTHGFRDRLQELLRGP